MTHTLAAGAGRACAIEIADALCYEPGRRPGHAGSSAAVWADLHQAAAVAWARLAVRRYRALVTGTELGTAFATKGE